jgi:predicted lipoprotein with Yx(FWY)xxD motif
MTTQVRRREPKVTIAGMLVALAATTACGGSDHGGLAAPGAAGAATSGDVTTGTSSTAAAGGAGGDTTMGAGGAGTGGSSTGGTGGSGTGGGEPGGAGGGGGGDAGPPVDGGPPPSACVFHSDPAWDGGVRAYAVATTDDGGDSDATVVDAQASDATVATADASDAPNASDAYEGGSRGGEGGTSDGGSRGDAAPADAGPTTSITVLTSPFIGAYLADSAGRTLYTYGGDMAGDCNFAPISGCDKDCIIAWPVFDAGRRTLPSSIDDHAFGAILRADGAWQTTYYGWPLYYYKTDTGPGVLNGQAKGKTWHAATVIPAGVVIMKNAMFAKYLADGNGRTLYVYNADVLGTSTVDPVSNCGDACLVDHPVFERNRISVVSSLEPTDFTLFVRSRGQQLAYRGAPLYYSSADVRSGDTNGATTAGWSLAVP